MHHTQANTQAHTKADTHAHTHTSTCTSTLTQTKGRQNTKKYKCRLKLINQQQKRVS